MLNVNKKAKPVLLVMLILVLCIIVQAGSITNVFADLGAPLELGSVIQLPGDLAGRNITTSAIDGLNATVMKSGNEATGDQFTQINFFNEITDWTDADNLVLQVNNPFWGNATIGFCIVDPNGKYYGTQEPWKLPEETLNDPDYAYYVSNTLDGAKVETRYFGYGALSVPSAFNGYIHIPINNLKPRWGAPPMNKSNIVRVEIEYDTQYNFDNKLNFGNMYLFDAEATIGTQYAKSFDISKIKKANGTTQEANAYYMWPLTPVHDELVRVEIVKANTIKTYQLYTNQAQNQQWSPFYMNIPMNISAYNGISYYVDTTEASGDIFFNKFIREWTNSVSGEEYYCDTGFAEYYPDGGDMFVGDTNTITKGFKGTIVVPFSNFALPGWWKTGGDNNGILNLESVWWNFGFTFEVTRGNRSFIIKDFKLVTDACQFQRNPQVASWTGDMKTTMPMEYYDNYDLRSDWATNWNLAANCTVNLISNPSTGLGFGGSAMEFICGTMKTSEANYSYDTALEHYPNNDQKDISGAKGFTFWVKNTSAKQLVFKVGFDLLRLGDAQQRWEPLPSCRYQMFNTATGAQNLANGKWGICIPANFEGWIRIDFSQFVNPSWVTVSAPFDASCPLAYFVINVNADMFEGYSFILDSFGVYYTDVEIATTFNKTPAYGLNDALTSNYGG